LRMQYFWFGALATELGEPSLPSYVGRVPALRGLGKNFAKGQRVTFHPAALRHKPRTTD